MYDPGPSNGGSNSPSSPKDSTRKVVAHAFAQIVIDSPPDTDGAHDRAEVVVEQYDG